MAFIPRTRHKDTPRDPEIYCPQCREIIRFDKDCCWMRAKPQGTYAKRLWFCSELCREEYKAGKEHAKAPTIGDRLESGDRMNSDEYEPDDERAIKYRE